MAALTVCLLSSNSNARNLDCGAFATTEDTKSGRTSFLVRHFEEKGLGIFSFRQTVLNENGEAVFTQAVYLSDKCNFNAHLSRGSTPDGIYLRLSNPNGCRVHETNSDPIERVFQPTFFEGLLISLRNQPLSEYATIISEATCLKVHIE